MKKIFYTITFLFFFFNTLFAQPTLIFDDFKSSYNGRFYHKGVLNNQFVFTYRHITDDIDNTDIWITDGTSTTNLTENIDFFPYLNPVVVGNELYFIEGHIDDPVTLWKTDGTIAGREKAWESIRIYYMEEFQGKLFLSVKISGSKELWVIDGTTRTKLMTNTNLIFGFSPYNGFLYYYTDTHGLMKTDGTVAGTTVVKAKDNFDFLGAAFYNSVVHDGELYFLATDSLNGSTFWKTDGTTAGTISLRNLNPTVYPDDLSINFKIMTANEGLYFYSPDEIYLYDNQSFTKIFEYGNDERDGGIYTGQIINDKAVFVIETFFKNGRELWTTDGTVNGTKLLKEINRNAADGVENWFFGAINGYLYFQGNDGVFGSELWRTDGTEAGTTLVLDFSPNAASTIIDNTLAIGTTLYFTVQNYSLGSKPLSLWKFDLDNFTPQQPADYRNNNEWLSSIYGGYRNRLADFEMDKNNNVYLAILDDSRVVYGTIFYEQDTILARSRHSGHDVTIAKLSANNEFQWGTVISTGENYPHTPNLVITPDENENLFVAGLFRNQLKIGSTTITNNNISSFFIAKYKNDGMLEWLKTGRYEGNFSINEMLITSKNEVIIAGIFDKIDFENNTFTGNKSVFVLKINKEGTYQWLNKFKKKITNITADLTPNDEVVVATANEGFYLYKVNQMGNTLWEKNYPTNKLTYINNVKVSPTNDIFMIGNYGGTLQLGNQSATFADDDFNAFLIKFNAWGEPIRLLADEATTSRYTDLIFDTNNNYFLLKKEKTTEPIIYENWADLTSNYITSIQKFDANGQLLKERKLLNGGGFSTTFSAIEVDDNGGIYYADMYVNQLDTFGGCIKNRSDYAAIPFVLHFNMDDKMVNYEPIYTEIDLTIAPNPMTTSCLIYIHDANWQTYHLNIYSSTGQLVKSMTKNDISNVQSVRVADLPTGLLIFEFNNGTEKLVRKVIKY